MNADSLTPAAPGDVRLRGRAGAAADACLLARADSDWARGPMYDECVNSFRTHWDNTNPDSPGWQNEYWGKTMLCFAGAVAYTRDPELRSWVLARAHEFIAEFQKPNGYLSTYSREDFLRNHPENPDARTHWCFNVWGRKYTLWALIELHKATGDSECLAAAVRMADHLIAQLGRLGLTLDKTGAWHGVSSMSILRPLLELYRLTGTDRYLSLARDIVRAMDPAPDVSPSPATLISDAFRAEPIHAWYPLPTFWAKAYEILSCLEGLVEYHRATGDRRALDAVLSWHGRLVREELLRPLPPRRRARERHDGALRRRPLDPPQPRAAAPHGRSPLRGLRRGGVPQRLPRRHLARRALGRAHRPLARHAPPRRARAARDPVAKAGPTDEAKCKKWTGLSAGGFALRDWRGVMSALASQCRTTVEAGGIPVSMDTEPTAYQAEVFRLLSAKSPVWGGVPRNRNENWTGGNAPAPLK